MAIPNVRNLRVSPFIKEHFQKGFVLIGNHKSNLTLDDLSPECGYQQIGKFTIIHSLVESGSYSIVTLSNPPFNHLEMACPLLSDTGVYCLTREDLAYFNESKKTLDDILSHNDETEYPEKLR